MRVCEKYWHLHYDTHIGNLHILTPKDVFLAFDCERPVRGGPDLSPKWKENRILPSDAAGASPNL